MNLAPFGRILFPLRLKISHKKWKFLCDQGKKGLVLLDQMRAVDKTRLIQKLGVISRNAQMKIVNCLQELFAY